ncbi:MAG TPA: AI-2E family transporter, partial [Methylomirabilota bacterium]|nr:AI-2E family transporter [Methylomirabilota bacterium]
PMTEARWPARLPWPLVFQVLGVIAAVWLVVHTWELWLLVFTALILAAAILPAARAGERYRIPRGVTVLLVYAAVVGVMVLMGRLLWPALVEQGRQFLEQLPRLIANVRDWVGDVESYMLGRWGASLPTPKGDGLPAVVGTVLANTFRVTTGALGALFGLLAILFVAAYLVIDARHVGGLLLALLPPAHRSTAARLAGPVLDRIGGYVRGQMVSSFFVGALIAIALSVLGVQYSLLIGALAAVFNIVPFVGATLALILGVLSALNQSLGLALVTAAVMTGAQTVEGKFLAPHFVGRATGLHPLAVLLALLAGGHLAGLIGALVAVPLLAGLWEVVRSLWVEPRQG